MIKQKSLSLFKDSAGILLIILASALFLINWTTPANNMPPHDPILFLPLNVLFFIVGGITAAVALFCLFSERSNTPIFFVFLLSVYYLLCRLVLRFEDCNSLVGFLGGCSYAFGITANSANTIIGLMFTYLLLGSSAAIWLQSRLPPSIEFEKMACPSCGGRVKFPLNRLGQKIACPICKSNLTLRKSNETLKMSCFFCEAHIEFPAHALSQRIKCPHCRREIGLREEIG